MPETKAKYHHLIPRTYLSAWEHGNGTLYVRFLENADSVVERNKDKIAGITNYHSSVAGMPIVTKEDADTIFHCLADLLVCHFVFPAPVRIPSASSPAAILSMLEPSRYRRL